MPLPFALVLAAPVGAMLAWLSRAELGKLEGPVVSARSFWVAVALGAFVLAPLAGYFVAFHGDWSYLYFVAWSRVPSAVDLALVLACGALVPGGFALAAPWCAARRGAWVLAFAGAPLALEAVATIALQNRLAASATFAQFHGGFGVESISQTSLGRAVLYSLAVLLLAAAFSAQLVSAPKKRE